jgi:hypothetical protein
MSFFAPAFLIGLAGLALPVLIHFLRRKKLQVIPWAAHRFLIASIKRNKQRLQFEDLLLLLLRCLLLALIVFAFARPLFNSDHKPGADAPDTAAAQTVLLVDHSASMGWSDGVRTRLEEIRELAETELAALPGGASVAVIAYSDRVMPVIARPTRDFALVRRELARLHPVSRGSDLAPALRAALDLLDTLPRGPRNIIILGDRQKLAWNSREALDTQAKRAEAAGITIKFHAPPGDAPVNLAVTRLDADTADAVSGQPVRFFVEVLNGGTEPASQVRLTLSPDGDAPAAEKLIPTLAPGARLQVEFTLTFSEAGYHAVTARVPADSLAFDDTRTLALRVSPGVRVLLVEGNPPAGSRIRPGFFLAEALAPVPPTRKASFPIQVERIAASELSTGRLASARAVVLAGVPPLSPEVSAALDRFVRAGGGLWVFPAASNPVANDPLNSLLPAEAGTATTELETAVTPAGPPYNHPISSLWNDPANGTLSAVTLRRHVPLTVRSSADASEKPEVVVKLADGSPLLVARPLGRGRILQSAIPGDTAWSDLPILPAFVPLVQRGLAWLQGGVSAPGTLAPDEAFTVRVDPALLGREFRVLAPGRTGAPSAAGRIELAGGQPSLRFTATTEPGLYRIFNDTDDAAPLAVFAVNPDSSESDLAPVDPARIAALTHDETATPGASASGSASFQLPVWLTRDLWRLLAGAALALVLVELWLAQRFSRAK